jgi:hypothetical protein
MSVEVETTDTSVDIGHVLPKRLLQIAIDRRAQYDAPTSVSWKEIRRA